MKRSIVAWMGLLGLCVCVLGCGGGYDAPSYSDVSGGKLTKGGQPLTVNTAEFGDYARIEMSFESLDEATQGLAFGATIAEDGSFTLRAPDDATVTGKYRVTVEQFSDGETDALAGKFAGEASPIEIDITPGQPINIELDDFGGEGGGE